MVKNAVKVAVRTRPSANFATSNMDIAEATKSIKVHVNKKAENSYLDNQREDYIFKFNQLLHNASQEQVYESCVQEIVSSAIDGYNGTVMCYGQTGAGKTFTMTGPRSNYKQRGIIPRAISQVFQEIHNRPERAFSVKVSYLEIYNEQLVDLLSEVRDLAATSAGAGSASATGTLPPTPVETMRSAATSTGISSAEELLQVMEDSSGMTFVRGLSHMMANDEEEALSLMFEGDTNRAITEHQLNSASSRSHCIFTIHVESRSRVESEGQTLRSKLNLVDLAGSERVGKTGSSGQVLKEASFINKSLSFLEQVVIALSTPNRDHIPYRQSKLTYYLKDSIGGNCQTLMIANIWGEAAHLDETVSTLKFATRMMRVSNDAIINVILDPQALIKRYERQVHDLKQELAMHDQLKGVNQVTYDEYTDDQRLELRKQLRRYVNDEIDEIEVKNLRHIKEIMGQFKIICRNMAAETEERMRTKFELKEKGQAGSQSAGSAGGKSSMDDGVGEDDEGGGFGAGRAPAPAGQFTKSGAAAKSSKNAKAPAEVAEPQLSARTGKPTAEATAAAEAEREAAAAREALENSRNAKTPVPKNTAFEEFKKTHAQELVATMKENSITLNEKKRVLKELTQTINDAKRRIDDLKDKIDEKKADREQNGINEDEVDVVDEEEMLLFKGMKEAKQTYRNAFEERKMIKSEFDYVSRVIDTTRQRMVNDFEEWYSSTYGGEPGAAQSKPQPQSGQQQEIEEEQLDDGEKFERLEAERLRQQDPESMIYFRAKRKTETNKALVKMKKTTQHKINTLSG